LIRFLSCHDSTNQYIPSTLLLSQATNFAQNCGNTIQKVTEIQTVIGKPKLIAGPLDENASACQEEY
jgi:hypothetical protein